MFNPQNYLDLILNATTRIYIVDMNVERTMNFMMTT